MRLTATIITRAAIAIAAIPGIASADYFSLWTAQIELPGGALAPSFIGDFDDDGRLELVSSQPNDASITQIRDLVTGQVEYELDWALYQTPITYHAIDVDLDGNAEILIPGDGGFRVVDWLPAAPAPDEPDASTRPSVQPARPNPFHPTTTIAFNLMTGGSVALSVYDPSGRLVRRLLDGPHEAGQHIAIWDGRDAEGRPLASGTYSYDVVVDGRRIASSKVVLLK